MKTFGLRTKIVMGLLATAILAIGACSFCIISFQGLQSRMRAVNEVYVPSLKLLSQMESQLFLFEQDLDRALLDAKVRPKIVDLQAMQSKLRYLEKLQGSGDFDFSQPISNLQSYFDKFSESVDHALAALARGEALKEEQIAILAQDRASLRHELRSLLRSFEREAGLQESAMQADMNRSGIFVTLLLAVLLMVAVALIYLASRALEPLGPLTETIQAISERGFTGDENRVLQLAKDRNDEVGTLAKEFARMTLSLRDRAAKIEEQKKNLEKTHLEMAKQNFALRQTQAKLVHQEKLALVGRLSSQVAHEIRNPLNALGLHFELLEAQTKADDEGTRQSLLAVRKELDRLAAVTESYLSLARTPKLEPVPLVLSELVREAQDLYRPWLEGQGIELDLALGGKAQAKLDRQSLQQVLGNIIKNAAESFGSETKQKRRIRLETRDCRDNGVVEFVCSDNGRGISDSVAKEIFSPFFTTKAGGTGIGLAHCKQLIEAQGGNISFASREGQGTIFTIRLPMGGVGNA